MRYWLDGQLRLDSSSQTTATGLDAVSLGRNFNWTPATPVSEWWGEVRIWTTDPGW
jgi:hypothetical protein